ncbi:MAG TPA: methyltransferase, partial [Terriglobia bacterium]|nr:methyltransferase [Terriglobia bacterium]
MNSKERVLAALSHREPDRVPIDFGSTAVTGIHVSCVAALREHYGLERHPVKVHEPYQMLGMVEEDLKEAMGLDVDGIFPRKTIFGFANEKWKSWKTPQGLEVMVSEDFRLTTDEKG